MGNTHSRAEEHMISTSFADHSVHCMCLYVIFRLYRFSYDLGKGPARIISVQQVKMNQWHQLQVYRNGINGYLVLNGQRVSGFSAAGASQLNLDTEMYLGGGVQGVSQK